MTASTKPSVPEMEAIAARHAHLLQSSSKKGLKPILIGAGVVLYLIFSWWFFSIGHVLANANWGIAGSPMKSGPKSRSRPTGQWPFRTSAIRRSAKIRTRNGLCSTSKR
ncbi:hypothetical protein ABIA19_004730 [Sinorhizobium fredii]